MAGSDPSSPNNQKLIDRLSNLPKHILLNILSFLPTEIAVATSVLSKRWQHLWTLVPTIDLGHHGWCETLNESIVSKVLDSNKAPIIRRFRLSVGHVKSSYFNEWLSSATQRNIEELDLDFKNVRDSDYGHDYRTRGSTFGFCCAPESCKTLVVLKVKVDMYGTSDSHFLIGGHLGDPYFPTLKILHLNRVGFQSQDPSLSSVFFSSCFPLLEELDYWSSFHRDIKISLPKLRHLEINFIKKDTLHIEPPSLQYLLLSSEGNVEFHVQDLHNLVEAIIEAFYYMRHYEYEESLINKCDDKYGESLINFVNALSNVRVLNLSLTTMQSLLSHSLFHEDRIQTFHNLVQLDLHIDGSLLGITMIMLSKFENLEHLKITHNKTKTEYCLVPPTNVPNCLTYHLKTFCFQDFRCSKYEMEFTIYILKNSLVLETGKILFRRGVAWKKGYDSKKILSKTSRGSLECKLQFDQYGSEFVDIDSYSDYSE